MVTRYLRRFAEWAIAWRRRLGSSLVRAVFAREILGGQKLFISNVAHELRTPLSTIRTSSEVALLDPGLPRDARKAFAEIIEELNRASEILNNLVSLNALAEPERMAVQNLDLGAIADDARKRLAPLARERGVRVLARQQAGAIAVGNRAGLEQVAYNVIKNAIAFSPAREGRTVVVRVYPEGEWAALAVEDHGVGMSQEEVVRVFEPFYRADASRNRAVSHSGSGLGLTIVQEIVRAHQGSIRIDSRKRAGTTVVVRLPRGGFIPHSGEQGYNGHSLRQAEPAYGHGRRT